MTKPREKHTWARQPSGFYVCSVCGVDRSDMYFSIYPCNLIMEARARKPQGQEMTKNENMTSEEPRIRAIGSAARQIAEKELAVQKLRDELGELRSAVRREDTDGMRRYLGPSVCYLTDESGWGEEVLKLARKMLAGGEL